jgi:hypothetical protein
MASLRATWTKSVILGNAYSGVTFKQTCKKYLKLPRKLQTSMQNRRRRDIVKNMEGSEREKNLQLKHKMIQYVEKKRTRGNVEGKTIWLKTNRV